MNSDDDPINDLIAQERRQGADAYVIEVLTAANKELMNQAERYRSAMGGALIVCGLLFGLLVGSWLGFALWRLR